MNIFFIGYRCTGKTSVGKRIAQELGWRFVDADELLMEEDGNTVAEIVSKGGWPLFRKLEKEILNKICNNNEQVVATGGGVVLDPENITRMKQSGVIVWLRAGSDTILERMRQDQQTKDLRPSLTSKGQMEEIKETLLKRTHLYENAATIGVDTDEKKIDNVCREVIDSLKIK